MRNKRVLVDIYYLYVAQTGIKTYTASLVESIQAKHTTDFEYIISPSYTKVKSSQFYRGKTPKWKNLLFQGLYLLRKAIILPLLTYWYRSDIVFSPDIVSPLWSRGKKLSVIHDAFFWENPSHYNPHWLKYYLWLLKTSLRRNAQVVTITDYSKKQIQKYLKMPQLSVHVVYPASNIIAKEQLEDHSIISSPYFLHVGVMEKRKNLVTLIRAFSKFLFEEDNKEFQLVLVGQRGPRKELDDYDNIIREIERLGLEEKVILPGFVSKSELDNYYRHAFAYVFPSLSEGFGMPILEAFSYMIPVIISNQGALREVGGDAVLYPEDDSATAFAQEMGKLVKDNKVRKSLVERAEKRLKNFSGSRFLAKLEKVFSTMTLAD
ncbi:glycosyltransferase family 4 protein [Echinicola shivajiensis]|uniref:glycosyltransferase family 4 protein n=1 Tax=Echinicola shivajiensis TaxID=1035916 RepID=UPI001BFC3724|nr:glycosyltransferase family 1 protein [Echinicola shivajiensis]